MNVRLSKNKSEFGISLLKAGKMKLATKKQQQKDPITSDILAPRYLTIGKLIILDSPNTQYSSPRL